MSQYPADRRDPTDPISGVMIGTFDTLSEICLGVMAGPIELGRQATPVLTRSQSGQRSHLDGMVLPFASKTKSRAPQVAAEVTIEAGKGLGRIVTASLKTPVVVLNGLTRGFHNLPKAYGEEVREYENVTGIKSGLLVSAKVRQELI
jgi:hypothetical protein